MEPSDRWEHVERLYHAALAHDAGGRTAFLREACAGDEMLRREVESLLAYESSASGFMAATALEALTPGSIAPARLTSGERFGPYRIDSLLGAGGMGDVYRARDTKLRRDVAIKILPDAFREDSDRRARFEREARLLASLNHPHIGAIYGFEDRDGLYGLVLELADGQTLADRLRAGPVPIHEALAIARQVTDALEAAHRKGIVHRDLKPANIAITSDGVVKVLDFGLAKVVSGEPPGATLTSSGGVSGPHVILGTVTYMSPEQARGTTVDTRTDVWAFGCVLWEMLTGRAPFAGNTVSDTIAAILERQPDWRLLPPGTPASVTRLLQRCLEKDPALRFQEIALARVEMSEAPDAGSRGAGSVRRSAGAPLNRGFVAGALLVLTLAVGGMLSALWFAPSTRSKNEVTFEPLTNFTDSAFAPAVSPDGRMVAFIRGDRPFLSTDQIYVKMLPNGEPMQLTRDPRPKYGAAFSPDGSRIAYTVALPEWSTYAISPLGGEPTLLLPNAAGLTWLDARRVLFSAIKTGLHMGIATATVNRSEYRDVYFPRHERSMAHYSFASPDRRWALVVEMDYRPVWEPCRLISLDGSTPGRSVGPQGRCSSAGWSPDGSWMYFSAEVGEESHLWRQRFPNGEPEQLTHGPTQEDGVAVAPNGSIVTSIGMEQRAIWIHDARGERPLSSEGQILNRIGSYTWPSFSQEGKRLTYLRRESPASSPELWRTDLESGKSEPLLPGTSMVEYDVSPDGAQVVFAVRPSGKPSEIWIAPLDRSSPPRRIAAAGENSPYFGPAGEVLFRFTDGTLNYVGRMNTDGAARSRVVAYPIATVQTISPDRRWLVAITPRLDGSKGTASMAIPTAGGSPREICAGSCHSAWSPDGRFLFVQVLSRSRTSAGRMVAIPVSPETGLPDLPATGIQSAAQALSIPGSWAIERADLVPGLDRDTYAYVQSTVHSNLFRVTPP